MSESNSKDKKKLRIGFIHPDLGIGGAERLVVDAAVSLQRRGHDVVMFTSRHDPKRCFEETRDGTLQVHVLGSSLPRRIHPRLPATIIFSILRSLLLTVLLCLSLFLPGPASFFNPLSPLARFDVYIVDQQSVCVPLLRFFAGTRVVFYCHFPDKLLSGGWEVRVDRKGQGGVRKGGKSLIKRVYRWPVDKLEEWTTGQADVVLSNSLFSSRVYTRAFPSLAKRPPRVVYPCIDIDAYTPIKGKGKAKQVIGEGVNLIMSDRPTFVSLNRYEAKKNVALAIEAFAKLRRLSAHPNPSVRSDELRLVIAGGYDQAEADNVRTLAALQSLCDDLNLTHHTLTSATAPPPPETQVLFVTNFTTAQRSYVLTSPSTIALLYTPANEHFGIVPVEAMACGLPVIAADSGGPTESIVDLSQPGGTGILRPPISDEWSLAMMDLLSLSDSQRAEVCEAGKKRAREKFSIETLGKELEEACVEVANMPDVQGQIGDKLMWGGAAMMGFAAVNLALLFLLYGFKAS